MLVELGQRRMTGRKEKEGKAEVERKRSEEK
jgi:hypothetical protein